MHMGPSIQAAMFRASVAKQAARRVAVVHASVAAVPEQSRTKTLFPWASERKKEWRASWQRMIFMASRLQVDEAIERATRARIEAEYGTSVVIKSAKQIMLEVSAKHGVSIMQIIGPNRFKRWVRARQEYFWRCSNETIMSLDQMGRSCGLRDHSTVWHGIRQHQKRIDAGEA